MAANLNAVTLARMKTSSLIIAFALSLASQALMAAEALEAAVQTKVEEQIKLIQTWANDPAIVKAVKEHNAAVPADHAAMTQEKWKALPVLDPFVRSFTKNEAATALKSKKNDFVAEAFLSDANGLKVAFLSKTSNWSHKGKDKHDVPMTGKSWQGPAEIDESTGLLQVQVSVPVLEDGKPIGSLVVGLSVSKLK
jgi:uncharacterized protein YdbL (DUF1318 family)